ncbi:hypothetical protein DES36_11570 [Alkalibaculum bacchi]|uniref:Uncharacterized protein n=1 Tax=Alkalibaculum bacchi TaxID=645887 RepID=A0A366I121_9FIRM|nr:hypothetical protein DES36_11570 [Alkalibaculum bacchi]
MALKLLKFLLQHQRLQVDYMPKTNICLISCFVFGIILLGDGFGRDYEKTKDFI